MTFLCFVNLVLWKHAASVLLARVVLFCLPLCKVSFKSYWFDTTWYLINMPRVWTSVVSISVMLIYIHLYELEFPALPAVTVKNSRNSCSRRTTMWDKPEINILFIWRKALFLLSLIRILAGKGKLSWKDTEISFAAYLVQLSLAWREDLGSAFSRCSMTKHASHAEQFPIFPGSLSADTQTQPGALTFSAAPSRNLPEVDLTIQILLSPRINFWKNACMYSGVAVWSPNFRSLGEVISE